MLKKTVTLIGIIILLASLCPAINAIGNQEIKILFKVNSKTISIYENNEEKKVEINYPVIIKNGRLMVESFFFLQYWHFGGDFLGEYVTDTKEVRFTFRDNENNKLVIIVDTKTKEGRAFYNDSEIKMDVVPFQPTYSEKLIMVSHFVLPLRFIFETFGYTVEWNNETREITVYKINSISKTHKSTRNYEQELK